MYALIFFMIVFMVCIPNFVMLEDYRENSIDTIPSGSSRNTNHLPWDPFVQKHGTCETFMGFSWKHGKNWNKYMVNGKYMAFCSSFFIRLNGNTW